MFYLAYKDHAKLAQLVPVLPCGIILCAEKDNIVVEYALHSVKKPVGVAEYYLTKKLPKHLRGKLPEAEDLKLPIRQELG